MGGVKLEDIDIGKSLQRLQVLVFYESDWDPSSLSLITQFSKLKDQLLANNCSLFGCSTDTVATHLQWIKVELGDKFSLYDSEERLCLRGVVVVDSKGEPLETIVSGLGEEELAKLTLKVVLKVPKSSHILESCRSTPSSKDPSLLQTSQLTNEASASKSGLIYEDCGKKFKNGRNYIHHLRSHVESKQREEGVEHFTSPVMRTDISRIEKKNLSGAFSSMRT